MSIWLWQRRTTLFVTLKRTDVEGVEKVKKLCFCLTEWGILWNALPWRWCCSFKSFWTWINRKACVPLHFKNAIYKVSSSTWYLKGFFGGGSGASFLLLLFLRQVREVNHMISHMKKSKRAQKLNYTLEPWFVHS